MVQFVGLILLGSLACMATAIPLAEDSSDQARIRRFSDRISNIGINPEAKTHVVSHNGHIDEITVHPDGSQTIVHGHDRHGAGSNGRTRARRFSDRGSSPGINPGQKTSFVAHGDHIDQVTRNADGTVTIVHGDNHHRTSGSNEHVRVRRLSLRAENYGGVSFQVPHKDHVDEVSANIDGSVTTIHGVHGHDHEHEHDHGHVHDHNHGHVHDHVHNHEHDYYRSNPGYNQQYGFNPNYNNGVYSHYNTRGLGYGNNRGHFVHSDTPVADKVEYGKDEYGHDIVTKTEIFSDGHSHTKNIHI